MAVTINATTTGVISWAGHDLQVTSAGRWWVAIWDTATARIEMWYSDDSGATWAENTAARFSSVGVSTNFAFYIDADDHAHVVYCVTGTVSLSYRRNKSISTTSAWSSATTVDNADLGYSDSDLVVHREGTGWVAHVVATHNVSGPDEAVVWTTVTISSTDVVAVGTRTTIESASGPPRRGTIDFHHTSTDEKAIQGATPHLYIVWTRSLDLKFVKCTYSAGSWTKGTTRTIRSAGSAPSALSVFDGSRVIIASQEAGDLNLYERDAADTTTTTRAAGGATFTAGGLGAVTYDASGNVWVVGVSVGDLKTRMFIRATLLWDVALTIDTDDADGWAFRRYAGNDIPVIFDSVTASRIRADSTSVNVAPSSPTWVNVDNAGADVGAALVLDWNFVDANPSDTQTAYTLRRQIGAGAYAYWRASDSTWQAGVQKVSTATSAVTLASAWGLDADANHKFAVLTYDLLDVVGPYSAELTVTPSTPSPPTITTPVNAGVVASASLTVVWTCASQSTLRVQLFDPSGFFPYWDSGVVSAAATRSQTIPYALVNGTSYKVRVTTTNAEGLAATPTTHDFSVSYTLPATPTLVVAPSITFAKVTIAPTQPTPGVGQPTVTSIDVLVRCVAGRSYPDRERPVGGDGIRVATGLPPSTVWVDYPSAGVAYEYKVRAWGDNMTYSDSAWTA